MANQGRSIFSGPSTSFASSRSGVQVGGSRMASNPIAAPSSFASNISKAKVEQTISSNKENIKPKGDASSSSSTDETTKARPSSAAPVTPPVTPPRATTNAPTDPPPVRAPQTPHHSTYHGAPPIAPSDRNGPEKAPSISDDEYKGMFSLDAIRERLRKEEETAKKRSSDSEAGPSKEAAEPAKHTFAWRNKQEQEEKDRQRREQFYTPEGQRRIAAPRGRLGAGFETEKVPTSAGYKAPTAADFVEQQDDSTGDYEEEERIRAETRAKKGKGKERAEPRIGVDIEQDLSVWDGSEAAKKLAAEYIPDNAPSVGPMGVPEEEKMIDYE